MAWPFSRGAGAQTEISALQEQVTALSTTLGQTADTNELLSERLAELELSLEDQWWDRLSGESTRELSRAALGRIVALARLYYLRNPLINRAVSITAEYVWAQGVNISAKDESVNAVVQAFLDDPQNRKELTGAQARILKEVELECTGNLFFVLFPNVSTGRVRLRSIDLEEIIEVVTDPDDAQTPQFYKRTWSERRLNPASGQLETIARTSWYPDWQYTPKAKPKTIGGAPVQWTSPVFHIKVGAFSKSRFGVPEVYSALDWAKAYKEFLEDWATITRALSRFAWKVKTAGGAAGVAAAKTKLGTTFATGGDATIDTNPPPTVGSMFLGGTGTDLEPVKTAGAVASAEDGRRILLMVCAATGLPETFFGDVSTGARATAKTLDRPTELKMLDRRGLWTDTLVALCGYAVDRAALAPNGPLPGTPGVDANGDPIVELGEGVDRSIDVSWPSILEHDVLPLVQAIVAAATLSGNAPAGTLDPRTLVRLLLTALSVDNIDEILDLVAPEDGESLMDHLAAQKADQAQANADALAKAGDPANSDDPKPQPATEAVLAEALAELRDAVRQAVGVQA